MKLLFKARPLFCQRALIKTLRIMKITAFILLAFCLQVSAEGNAQNVTLKVKNASLETVFKAIKKQTNFTFFAKADLLDKGNKVTLDLTDVPLKEALDACFKNQPFTYSIEGRIIIVEPILSAALDKTNNSTAVMAAGQHPPPVPILITIHGRIVNENGEPVRATVAVKGTNSATATNDNGEYELKDVDEKATLVITGVSIEAQEVKVNSRELINVSVRIAVKEGEEIVVAYNKTTAQKNVSSLTVVKGEQIQNLPNRSFEKSLEGLVPGLLVNSGSGQPGGATNNFVLRGIATGGIPSNGQMYRSPLIVIDGIPVFQDPLRGTGASGDASESNPIAQLNPSDIETITILKDAAAIALYGSKASNGVILVTTKKGKSGKTKYEFRHLTEIAER
ncbi:MAG TPA: TonB-dependent receptor plug domain-containing protein, partial [Chitinophagaceae bacterium]|nr:TonB-dependent receptor plug domain-containing protein [Chitinophagaceae bacterium]